MRRSKNNVSTMATAITSFVSIIGSFRFSSALMNFVNRLHICSTIGYVNFVCKKAETKK